MKKLFFAISVSFTFNLANATQIKVLSFNVWAVPVPGVSKEVDKRFELIPQAIQSTGADIVFIQEVWKQSRKEQLINSLREVGYEYFAHGYPEATSSETWGARGLLGNGLLIASKFPLSEPRIMKFTQYTRYDEYMIYKGAIYVQAYLPEIGVIDVFSSHLGAFDTLTVEKGDHEIPDHMDPVHMAVKMDQARELLEFVKSYRSQKTVLLVLDMNTHYFNFLNGRYDVSHFGDTYSMFSDFVDTYASLNGHYGLQEDAPRPFTYDTGLNDYARDGVFASEPPGVLDYIFINTGAQLKQTSSEVIFKEKLSDNPKLGPLFLSDHFGLITTFETR